MDSLPRSSAKKAPSCLVTGATGFIGGHLLKHLGNSGWQVRAIQRKDIAHQVHPNIDWVQADLQSVDRVQEAMEGTDVLFHLAGIGSPSSLASAAAELYQVNVIATLNVLEAARLAGIKRVVVASSAAVYGSLDSNAISEESETLPVSVYGLSKLAQERAVDMYGRNFGIEAMILRLFNVYGPGDDLSDSNKKLIPSVYRRIQNGEPISIFGDGSQSRDFVHVEDVVSALETVALSPVAGSHLVNIGTGVGVNIRTVVGELAAAMKSDPELRFLPSREGEVQQSVADCSKAESLGIRSSIEFGEGIASFVHQANPMEPWRQ